MRRTPRLSPQVEPLASSGWGAGLFIVLSCGGLAADGDGSPSLAPDVAGAVGGASSSGRPGTGVPNSGSSVSGARPARPPRDVSSAGGMSAGGGSSIDPDPGEPPDVTENRCPQLALGELHVRNQGELEALRGCTSIEGDLTIYPFRGVDLTPLSELKRVGGALTLGDRYADPSPDGFSSLAGLESLHSVGALALRGVRASSLETLSGLTEIGSSTGIAPISGRVFIEQCPELVTLHGLENMRGLEGFAAISNPKLVSVAGLQVPDTLVSFEIWSSPVTNIGALAGLTTVNETLRLIATALPNVEALARLTHVDQLDLERNSGLVDVTGLSALTSARSISILGNAIESVPTFPVLGSLDSLIVVDNPSLSELGPLPALRRIHDATIGSNPRLSRLAALSAVESATQIDVRGNAALVDLDLGRLALIEQSLHVSHNPLLDSSSVPRPPEGNVVVGGNRGEALQLDPCPWSGNGSCEAAPFDDLCAAGSDGDCSDRAP